MSFTDNNEKYNLKHILIICALCINQKDNNDYIKHKLDIVFKNLRINNNLILTTNKNITNKDLILKIKNKDYEKIFLDYQNKFNLNILLEDLQELINLNLILASKEIKKKIQLIIETCINLEFGFCNLDYIRYSIENHSLSLVYDSRNFINHLDKLKNLVDKKEINNVNYYYLKKDKKVFLEVFKILEQNNYLHFLQNSVYSNICDFTPNDEIVEIFKKNSLSLKDFNLAKQFLLFKTSERDLEDIDDSLLFKKTLLSKNIKCFELIKKIIKRNNLSSYSTVLLLEHLFYISECFNNEININEQYFEKCLLSLYNGDAKNINEKI